MLRARPLLLRATGLVQWLAGLVQWLAVPVRGAPAAVVPRSVDLRAQPLRVAGSVDLRAQLLRVAGSGVDLRVRLPLVAALGLYDEVIMHYTMGIGADHEWTTEAKAHAARVRAAQA